MCMYVCVCVCVCVCMCVCVCDCVCVCVRHTLFHSFKSGSVFPQHLDCVTCILMKLEQRCAALKPHLHCLTHISTNQHHTQAERHHTNTHHTHTHTQSQTHTHIHTH